MTAGQKQKISKRSQIILIIFRSSHAVQIRQTIPAAKEAAHRKPGAATQQKCKISANSPAALPKKLQSKSAKPAKQQLKIMSESLPALALKICFPLPTNPARPRLFLLPLLHLPFPVSLQLQEYRRQLQEYTEQYFSSYRQHFSSAFEFMDSCLAASDYDGAIYENNQIAGLFGAEPVVRDTADFKRKIFGTGNISF